MREQNENKKGNITIGDIAKELGVSKTTVSRAISGKGRIGSATKEKVKDYIEKHDYKPNIIAKGLAQSRTYNICVTFPGDSNLVDIPFFQTVLMGICEFLSARDYDVVVANITENNISNLIRIVSNRKTDGVILSRTVNNSKAIEYLLSKDIPFVTVGTYPNKAVIQVDADHKAGCRELTSILLMKGIRRMALLGGNKEYIVNQKRYKGFAEAYKVNKIPFNSRLLFENLISTVEIEKAVDDVLMENAECIMCMDDNICACVIRKLRREGICVPERVKVASFFGSVILEGQTPSITCLEFDTKELGIISGRTILAMLSDDTMPQRKLLGYEVVLKESTK